MGADSFPALRAAVAPTGSPDPVLPAQHGMILNYLRFPDDGVDIIQATLDWTGPLERAPFEAARHVAARLHPIVRTVFRTDDGDGLVQVIDPDASIDIRWRDLAQPQASGPDHPFESFLRADPRERFDLTQGPLVRLTILRRVAPTDECVTGAPAHRAVLTFHYALPLFLLLGLAVLVTTLIGAANPRLRAVGDRAPGTPVLEPSPAVASGA